MLLELTLMLELELLLMRAVVRPWDAAVEQSRRLTLAPGQSWTCPLYCCCRGCCRWDSVSTREYVSAVALAVGCVAVLSPLAAVQWVAVLSSRAAGYLVAVLSLLAALPFVAVLSLLAVGHLVAVLSPLRRLVVAQMAVAANLAITTRQAQRVAQCRWPLLGKRHKRLLALR